MSFTVNVVPGDASYAIPGSKNSNQPASFPWVAEHTGGGATQSVYREIHNQYADALQPWVNPLQRVQGIQAAGLLEPHPRPVVLAQQPYLAPVNPHQMCYWDHPQSLDNDNATQIIFKA